MRKRKAKNLDDKLHARTYSTVSIGAIRLSGFVESGGRLRSNALTAFIGIRVNREQVAEKASCAERGIPVVSEFIQVFVFLIRGHIDTR